MEEMLKEIIESYDMIMNTEPYTYDRGKGTRSYCEGRINVMRSQLLEMKRNIGKHYE